MLGVQGRRKTDEIPVHNVQMEMLVLEPVGPLFDLFRQALWMINKPLEVGKVGLGRPCKPRRNWRFEHHSMLFSIHVDR